MVRLCLEAEVTLYSVNGLRQGIAAWSAVFVGVSLIGIACMLPPPPNLTRLVFCMHLVFAAVALGLISVNSTGHSTDRSLGTIRIHCCSEPIVPRL